MSKPGETLRLLQQRKYLLTMIDDEVGAIGTNEMLIGVLESVRAAKGSLKSDETHA